MNYIEFRKQLFDLACFSVNQVYAWSPEFDRNNLTRWIKKGYLVRLRQGYFAFSEYKSKPDYALYIANRIYRPSYISLHSALSFYGMIPEAIVQISSVSSLKTASFINSFGQYSYKSIRPELMFGFDLKPMSDGRNLQFASPEKALLDLLYIYPFYNSRPELEELRLDEEFMHRELNKELIRNYSEQFKTKALDQRVEMLLDMYEL